VQFVFGSPVPSSFMMKFYYGQVGWCAVCGWISCAIVIYDEVLLWLGLAGQFLIPNTFPGKRLVNEVQGNTNKK